MNTYQCWTNINFTCTNYLSLVRICALGKVTLSVKSFLSALLQFLPVKEFLVFITFSAILRHILDWPVVHGGGTPRGSLSILRKTPLTPSHCLLSHLPWPGFKPEQRWETASSQSRPLAIKERQWADISVEPCPNRRFLGDYLSKRQAGRVLAKSLRPNPKSLSTFSLALAGIQTRAALRDS